MTAESNSVSSGFVMLTRVETVLRSLARQPFSPCWTPPTPPLTFTSGRWRGWWCREGRLAGERPLFEAARQHRKRETTRGRDSFVTCLWQQNHPALDSNYNLFLTLTKWVLHKETSTSAYQNVKFLHIHGLHYCIFPAFTSCDWVAFLMLSSSGFCSQVASCQGNPNF